MKPDKPFHLEAEALDGSFNFDGETWTRTPAPGETENEAWVFARVLARLNSQDARHGLLYVEPRYAHAQAMLDYAVGPGEWKILSASPEEDYEELGEFPAGYGVEPPPDWDLTKGET